jgi:hypothetical protein
MKRKQNYKDMESSCDNTAMQSFIITSQLLSIILMPQLIRKQVNTFKLQITFRRKKLLFLNIPKTSKIQFTTAAPEYWCVHKAASQLLDTFHPPNPKCTFP